MPTYIALANYTERGLQQIRESPKRLDGLYERLREMGGEIKTFYLTMGEHDIVFIYEAPDDAVSARFLLQVGAAGFIRTRTMRVFPETAFRQIIASLG